LNKKASIYNLLAVGIKILAGPLVYYFISVKFDPFFLIAYFFILTINNMRTIFEGGVTNIVKRNYITGSKINIKSINTFSYLWFLLVSIILFIVSLTLGILYIEYVLNSFEAVIFPLLLASFVSSLRVSILYIDAYVDGYISSVIYRKSLLISNLVSTIVLIAAIELDFTLYSVFLSQLAQVIIIYFLLKKHMGTFEIYQKKKFIVFRSVYKRFKSLIQPTIKTWSIGYVFWNATFWITPILFQGEISASILFSYAVFKSVYDVSASFIHSNIPLITKKINEKLTFPIKNILFKILTVSSLLYFMIALILILFINLNIIESLSSRFLNNNELIFLAILFYIILLKTIIHNFIRCYQIEPFFYFVVYNAIIMLFSLVLANYTGCSFFMPHVLFLVPMLGISFLMLNKKLNITYE